jgi:serine/threonine protein kinase
MPRPDEYWPVLEAKRRELLSGSSAREEILIEPAADEFDRLQHQLNREVAIRKLDRESALLKQFGRVFMVRIHPEHHNFRSPPHCYRGFAIKQLLQNDRVSFKREVDILKKFSGEKRHPHVVSLLATYEQFNKFHLIFYRAEGNLFKYWKKINPSPEFNYDNVVWMAKQCAGIAHGLLRLHKHHTIKAASAIPLYNEDQEFKRRSTGGKSVRVDDPLLQNPRQTSGHKPVEPASPT